MEATTCPVASTSYHRGGTSTAGGVAPALHRARRHRQRRSAVIRQLHRSLSITNQRRRPLAGQASSADGQQTPTAATPAQPPDAGPLADALSRVDALLALDTPESEAEAVALMRSLASSGAAPAFGGGQQVPKRPYSLDELRLNKIDAERYLSPNDSTLGGVRNALQGAALAGAAAAYFSGVASLSQIGQAILVFGFCLTLDQVAAGGGFEALAVDTAGRVVSGTYAKRVALHEAGHFLVAYLLGLLPRGYTLSALDAYQRSRQLNVQAGTTFCDREFSAEVTRGKLRGSSLGSYMCVALAGVATEYLRFGQAEGGKGDVAQLDALLRALQFSQKKAESEVRWAVLNTTLLLRRHSKLQEQLADAMQAGESVGECCLLIERCMSPAQLAPPSQRAGVWGPEGGADSSAGGAGGGGAGA